MARYLHPNAIDNGPEYIKTNIAAVWLVPDYTTAMSRAAADSAKLAAESMTGTDAVLSDQGTGRRLTLASKSGNATATAAGPHDLHYVYVSATEILFATDETTDQAITSGNPHTFSAVTLDYPQPVAP